MYVYISNTDGNFAHLCVNILFSFSLLAHRKYFQHLLIYEKAKEKLRLLCFSFSSFVVVFVDSMLFAIDLLLAVT